MIRKAKAVWQGAGREGNGGARVGQAEPFAPSGNLGLRHAQFGQRPLHGL